VRNPRGGISGFGAVFHALVWRPLRREKIRSGLTIAGIAVGVAVLVAIELANASALRAFGESVDAISGKANYQISSGSGTIDERLLLRLQPLWGRGARFAPVIDADGIMLPAAAPIRILGVDLLSDLHFRDYRFASIDTGGHPSASLAGKAAVYLSLFRPDSVVLPRPFATGHHLHLGDPIEISVGGRRARLVIRGLLEAKGPATAFNGSLAVADISVVQKAFGLEGRLSRIDLLLPDGVRVGELRSLLPSGLLIERPSRRNERVAKMLRAFRMNLLALAAVALLVGVFLVYNTVLVAVLRRRASIGISRMVGASRGSIFLSFTAEGALFGLLGASCGLGLGVGIARGMLALIARTVNALYVTSSPSSVALSMPVVLMGLAIGIGVSLISAALPAWEATHIEPGGLIRAASYQRVRLRRSVNLALAGTGALAAAALLTRPGAVDGIPVAGYASVIFMVAGFSLAAPLSIVVLCRLLREPFERLWGLTGRLAAGALPASLRRVAVATAALSLAIGMMVAVSLMVGSFRETVRIWVSQTVTSDLWLRPARGISNSPAAAFNPGIAEELAKVPFIEAFDRFRGREVVYHDSLISVGSGDFEIAASHGSLPMVTPRTAREALWQARARHGVIVSETLSLKFGLQRGVSIELPTAHGTSRFPITGIYRDYSNDRGVVVMDRALYAHEYADDAIATIAVYLRKGVDPEWARSELERLLGPKWGAFGFTNSSIRREVMRIFDQTFLITYALLGVAMIVAVLGIINTLAALIMERQREIGIYRVLGMWPSEIRRTILLESLLIGIISTAAGVVEGIALSWVLINVINRQAFGWTIAFAPPWSLIAGSLAVTFMATLLAGLVPARLAGRMGMRAAMQEE
jgi:putative ABC transport system permease protein